MPTQSYQIYLPSYSYFYRQIINKLMHFSVLFDFDHSLLRYTFKAAFRFREK